MLFIRIKNPVGCCNNSEYPVISFQVLVGVKKNKSGAIFLCRFDIIWTIVLFVVHALNAGKLPTPFVRAGSTLLRGGLPACRSYGNLESKWANDDHRLTKVIYVR